MSRLSATFRSTLLTLTAVWLAVVGSGVSMTHSHDDEPGATSPHRHLILFGVECPAETLEGCDGLEVWHAPVDPPADLDQVTDAAFVAAACLWMPEPPAPRPHVTTCWPVPSPAFPPSPLANRSAILRA